MTWNRSRRAEAILRLVVRSLFSLLGVMCASALIASAVIFYRSAQEGVAYRDVESLAKPIAELKEIWGENGELNAIQSVLEKKNQEVQAVAAELSSADQRILKSRLLTISANLSYLNEALHHRKSRAAEAVGHLQTKVTALKNRLGPPASPEKVLAEFLRETGRIFIAALWPIVVTVIVFYFLLSKGAPERLRLLLRSFKSLKLGSAEIVLDDSERAKASTEDTFTALREQAKLQYDLWVQRRNMRDKLQDVVKDIVDYCESHAKPLPSYRCTVHVPDIVFDSALYQLIDYLPRGGGRGRVFSVRFGIIGRVWRLFQADTQGGLPKVSDEDETKLVREWGMTREEAKIAAHDRPSFLCVPLAVGTDKVGIFYMDSEKVEAFSTDSDPSILQNLVKEKCRDKGLVAALASMRDNLSGRAPLIRVYER
jgi:hypothetical protein